jgi:hypothetical protein
MTEYPVQEAIAPDVTAAAGYVSESWRAGVESIIECRH